MLFRSVFTGRVRGPGGKGRGGSRQVWAGGRRDGGGGGRAHPVILGRNGHVVLGWVEAELGLTRVGFGGHGSIGRQHNLENNSLKKYL